MTQQDLLGIITLAVMWWLPRKYGRAACDDGARRIRHAWAITVYIQYLTRPQAGVKVGRRITTS
jgi:hypothetical protein